MEMEVVTNGASCHPGAADEKPRWETGIIKIAGASEPSRSSAYEEREAAGRTCPAFLFFKLLALMLLGFS